ncbi:hypothetical protein [Pelobium manganitolerans]|uniref:hypothetical protein n=1 Tax=Pelobium manganitolerans TaxID=1842495 RepID=UPI003FA3DB5C
MKLYILSTSLTILLFCCCNIKKQLDYKTNNLQTFYHPLKTYNGDTARYIKENFVLNKKNYIGKEICVLLKDLEIPILTYKLGPDPNMKDYFYISIQFYSDIIVNRKISNKIDPLIMPIVLENPVLHDVPNQLARKNKRQWTHEETAYWCKQKIKDIGIVDYNF